MAFMNKELKNELAAEIKPIIKKYKMSATFKIENYSTFIINVRKGNLFKSLDGLYRTFPLLTCYIEEEYGKDSDEVKFLREIFDVLNSHNHDNSDAMTDYFDVGFYVNVNVGQWNKSYTYEGK